MITAGVLLAAGASRRFGAADKLLALLHGQPLVTHAARALAAAKPDVLIAATRSEDVALLLDGFEIVHPPEDHPEHSDSLRRGIERAKASGADRAVVVLGDMPFVTPALITDVIAKTTAQTPGAATDGQRPMPPACFPAACFEDLMQQTGDRGAAQLLKELPPSALVQASNQTLRDIDTPAALDAAQNQSA